jgi:hypothetical protein
MAMSTSLSATSLSAKTATWFERLGTLTAFAVLVLTALAVVVVIALAIVRLPPLRALVHRLARGRDVPVSLSWLAGTSLHMDTFEASPDAGDQKAVAAVLAAQLGGAGVRRPLGGVDLATTPYRSASVLDNISEAVKELPEGRALAALIKLGQQLLPRDDVYLRGYLLNSPERGAGLVLNLVSDTGQVQSSGTLWADLLEPGSETPAQAADRQASPQPAVPPDVLRLALAGAAWVQFQLLEELGLDDLNHVRTTNWRSAALFEVAVHDEGHRSEQELRALYALALDRDPGNLPALFNLAVLELRTGLYRQAGARLERVLVGLAAVEALRRTAQPDKHNPLADARDPLYYQAHYNLAVALNAQRLHQELTAHTASVLDPMELQDLCRVARELEADIERTERLADGPRHTLKKQKIRNQRDARERLDILERIEGPFLVLVATRWSQLEADHNLEVPQHAGISKQAAHEDMHHDAAPAPAAPQFTRARVCATLAEWEHDASCGGPSGSRELAFNRIAGECPEVSYRTHYNRACYATLIAQRLGTAAQRASEREEVLECALAELEYALEPGDMVGWAQQDPSLELLRSERKVQFDEVVQRNAPQQAGADGLDNRAVPPPASAGAPPTVSGGAPPPDSAPPPSAPPDGAVQATARK